MTDTKPRESTEEPFARDVRNKAARIERGRRQPSSLFRNLIHVGVLGWVFMLPVVAGAFGGAALASTTGQRGHAIGPMLGGIALGAYLVWRQLRSSVEEDESTTPKNGADQ